MHIFCDNQAKGAASLMGKSPSVTGQTITWRKCRAQS